MEVNFVFTFNSLGFKRKVNPSTPIIQIINKIIKEEDTLKHCKVSYTLWKGIFIEMEKSFQENKIKNEDSIMVVSDTDLNESMSSLSIKETPYIFKVKKCITNHSHVNLLNSDLNAFIDRTFTVFKSMQNQYLLIYSYSENFKDYSLFVYDILKEKNIIRVNNAHKERVFTCIHYFYEYDKRDLLLTAAFDKRIKVWNISNKFELIFDKKPDYKFVKNTYLLSECLLSYNKTIYVIVTAYEIYSKGYNMLYYSLKGKNAGVLKNSKDNTNYVESFYNNKNIPYILAANWGNIKIFNFSENKLIKEFTDSDKTINYASAVIKEYNNKMSLIATCSDGILRIWDYNNPENILAQIQTYSHTWLIGLDLIDNQYLLGACADGTIKEFDLERNYVSCSLDRENYKDPLFVVKHIKINGVQYLFTHSFKGLIELWKE